MTPYWTDGERVLYHGDCLGVLPSVDAESAHLVCTDPPYALSFMGKQWDRALPDPRVWSECLRILKPGGFAFVFMTPRGDSLWRTFRDLEEAGFDVGFSPIFWVYLSGFPKGLDVSAAIDRAAGAEREVVGRYDRGEECFGYSTSRVETGYRPNITRSSGDITAPSTPLAAEWDGWRAGRQTLKPATECVIVAQKPRSEKTWMANVVKHGTGALNVRGTAVPFPNGVPESDGGGWGWQQADCEKTAMFGRQPRKEDFRTQPGLGRYPANVACSDEALGARSKYFSVDAWMKQHFPAWWAQDPVTWTEDGASVYCPKAAKAEKEAGLDRSAMHHQNEVWNAGGRNKGAKSAATCNPHPTCKPLALVAWLLTLGCQVGGTVVDPFAGTGTSGIAAKMLGLPWVGIELMQTADEPYCEIAKRRVEAAEYEEPQARQLTLEDVAG